MDDIFSASETTEASANYASEAKMRVADDFKSSKGKYITKYVSVTKYKARRNTPLWEYTANPYTIPSSQFLIDARGYNAGNVIGKMDVTYYIGFRTFNNQLAVP